MMKKSVLALAVLLVLLALAGSAYTLLYINPFQLTAAASLYIDADDDADSVCSKLSARAALRRPRSFRILARLSNYQARTGHYTIRPDDNLPHVLRLLRQGLQTPVNIVVPPVRTMPQLAANLASKLMTDSASIAHILTDSASCRALGYDTATIACLFIPNTYEVYWNIEPELLMRRMQREHAAFWTADRLQKADSIGLTPNEVAALASIIDEETNNVTEKPVIAGLYLNRLRIGMPLQADPTVKFALHDFSLRRILRKHLETDSPYNTYLYPGLPPGPIRIASISSIDAVLNYEHHNYFYMCAKDDFSGTHVFARSFREHQANARRYARALNKKNIK